MTNKSESVKERGTNGIFIVRNSPRTKPREENPSKKKQDSKEKFTQEKSETIKKKNLETPPKEVINAAHNTYVAKVICSPN